MNSAGVLCSVGRVVQTVGVLLLFAALWWPEHLRVLVFSGTALTMASWLLRDWGRR